VSEKERERQSIPEILVLDSQKKGFYMRMQRKDKNLYFLSLNLEYNYK
jgi:hypothetical protein